MCRVSEFHPDHILQMDIQPHQAWMRELVEAAEYGEVLMRGPARTVWDGDKPIACFGEVLLWGQTGEAWSVLASGIAERMTVVFRETRKLMGELKTTRLQAYVDAEFDAGIRWMFQLGFHVEGKLAHYLPNGHDAFLFARIAGGQQIATQTVPDQLMALDGKTALEKVLRLERELEKMPQITPRAVHHFSRGLYARELTIPKGSVCTGKMHRHDHISVVTRGDISVLTDDGVKRYQAGDMIFCKAGTKRAVYTHQETVWTTIHGTDETDLVALEAELIVPPAEFLQYSEVPQ